VRRFKKIGLVLALAALVTSVAACSSDGDSQATTDTTAATGTTAASGGQPYAPRPLAQPATITVIAPPPGEFTLPFYVAMATDQFAEENLTVEVVTTDPTSGFGMMARGDAQLMATGFLPATINAMAEGIPLVWVGTLFQGTTTDEGFWLDSKYIGADGKLDKAKFLEDKPMLGSLTGPTGLAAYPIYRYFEEYGVSAENGDYSVQTFSTTGDMVIAMENGAIAGGYLTSPFYASFEKSGSARLVAASFGSEGAGSGNTAVWLADPPIYGGVWVASDEFLKTEPEVAAAFYRAIARTIDTYLQGNYKDSPHTDMIAAALKQTPEQFTAAEGYFIFEPDQAALTPEAISGVIDFWLDVGALQPDSGTTLDFDPAEFTVRTPIEDALG
jgi:ABC-type nitrate/sulfonate/bicarbonate transport system substrate-binding protein